MKAMITCKEATKYISMKEEQKLSPRQRFGLWLHLGICGLCRLFMKQNRIITGPVKHSHEDMDAALSTTEKESIIISLGQLP